MTAPLRTSTKARTLEALRPRLRHAYVLPLHIVDAAAWRRDRTAEAMRVRTSLGDVIGIVRSSAAREDQHGASLAGVCRTIADVALSDVGGLAQAIDDVLASYPGGEHGGDEVLVQPMLRGARMAGVAFTHDPHTGAPYLLVSYDASGATDLVTSGRGAPRSFVRFRDARSPPPADLAVVVRAIDELSALYADAPLDVEFAVDADGRVCVLQVRPLSLRHTRAPPERQVLADWLFKAEKKLEKLQQPHPHLKGRTTLFGVMPDWNPAEMIGLRPRPLALSTYRELITNRTWSRMRSGYGYRDLSGFPLLVSILGVPFIDVRASFNSFVPAALADDAAERLIDHYVDRLANNPHLHDKVEFEVVLSCTFPGVERRAALLRDGGLRAADVDAVLDSLRGLTRGIVAGGLIDEEHRRLEQLVARRAAIAASALSPVARIFWLLEDCRSFGTLAFSGLARTAFVATQFLRGFVDTGVLDEARAAELLGSLHTVARSLGLDVEAWRRGALSRDELLGRYGHLRPGTYDILSRRYDEAFDEYFATPAGATTTAGAPGVANDFSWRPSERRDVDAWCGTVGLGVDADGLLAFVRAAIEGREHAKLLFSRNVSDAFVLLEQLGRRFDISREQLSWLDLRTVLDLYATLDALDLKAILLRTIDENQRAYETTAVVRLPELIRAPLDVEQFHMHEARPNFVGARRVVGDVVREDALAGAANLEGAVVCLPAADPGFDWLFTRRIAALVTTYGGMNSHMAIRAAELGTPAVIGCGPANAERWFGARRLEIDCGNALVRVIA